MCLRHIPESAEEVVGFLNRHTFGGRVATKVEETQQCAVNVNTHSRVCLHVWRRADARPLGRKRSMIETIMHLSVFLLTFALTRCFGDPSHVRQLISHTFSSTPSCSCLVDGLSVSHFHCWVFGRLLCSGAVSLYVNIVANLSLHSTATRQSLCWYTEKSVALGCTTTTRLTPENWALFIFPADAATLPILPGLFPSPSVRLWIVPGSPLSSPAGTPTKTKQ